MEAYYNTFDDGGIYSPLANAIDAPNNNEDSNLSAMLEDLGIEDLESILEALSIIASLISNNTDFDYTWETYSPWYSSSGLGSAYSRRITNIQEMYYFGVESVSETHRVTEGYYFITRIVRLPFDAPEIIRLDGFELDGLYFEFVSLMPIGKDGITSMYYAIVREFFTYSSDINQILTSLPEFIHHSTQNGYEGIMHLVKDSLITTPAASLWERHYIYQMRQYQNIRHGDVSSFAVLFIEDGIAFTVHEIDWQIVGQIEIDGMETVITNPVVTYRGWYSTATIPYFTTQATFRGVLQNFEHFPSALYEIQFKTRLADAQYTLGSVLPGLEHTGSYTQQTTDATQAGEGISSGAIMMFIILAGVSLALFVLSKMGLFRKIFALRKNQDDEDDEDVEAGDEDD